MTSHEVGGNIPADLRRRLGGLDLILLGGFHPGPDDGLPADGPGGTLFLVGNAGSAIWPRLSAADDGAPHPLDRWTRDVLAPLADEVGATVHFPFDKPPLPFQRWAMKATAARPSPLGILIHPDYGLWHAFRAAFVFTDRLDLPAADERPSPCDACAERPCLSACPVSAFSGNGYDVAACAGHLAAGARPSCADIGCRARAACPVASERAYTPDHLRFHMRAFKRSVVGEGG